MTTTAALALGGVSAGQAFVGRSVSAAENDDTERNAADLITPETQRAIDRALKYLAGRQVDDGSFESPGWGRNVAISALAGIAFISSGSTPRRGPYGTNVSRSIDYLLANTQEEGFIHVPDDTTSHGPMYGHGFATLFLAETYGMSRREDIREKLSKAVQLIVDTQNSEGGWRYQPQRRDADISVTICQVMALRAARNAGLYVPHETVERCIDYVKRCQNPDGGFMYMLPGGGSLFPRSAAGVVALYSAGVYEGPELEKGLVYLMREGSTSGRDTHYFYGHYYAVQAMWHAGGDYWTRWYPSIRNELLARQRENGSWMDPIGPEYATSMALIILQTPNNLLPIFQR